MKRHALARLAVLFLFTAACLTAQTTPRAAHVFIVSFDGGKPSVIADSTMPVLKKMVAEGACTWDAKTVVPSITLLAHASMVSGVGPAKHKITWNDWMPEKGMIPVPTIFSLVHPHGFTTAMYAGKPKFKHLNLPGSLDEFVLPLPKADAKAVAAAFAARLPLLNPDVCLIHFADPDTVDSPGLNLSDRPERQEPRTRAGGGASHPPPAGQSGVQLEPRAKRRRRRVPLGNRRSHRLNSRIQAGHSVAGDRRGRARGTGTGDRWDERHL